MSVSWRERLARAKKRMMEALELTEEDWDYIWDNIGFFCTESDAQCRAVLESEGRPTTQEEIDKLVDEMFQDEFDEMTIDIIKKIMKQLGYKHAKSEKDEEDQEDEQDEEDEENTEEIEEEEKAEVEQK